MEKLNIVEDGLAGLYCLNCGFSFTCDHSARYAFIERFDIKLKCGVMDDRPYEFMLSKKRWIELLKHLYSCKEGTRNLRLKFRVIR